MSHGGTEIMAKRQDNVVDLLLRQHREIRKLFDRLDKATGKSRKDTFERLRCLLAVHETAEEEIVHPLARKTIGNGERIINARLKEEKQAKEILQELEKLDPGSIEFESLIGQLRKAVEAHAEHEEHVEFPELLARCAPETLRTMAAAVRAAEAIAPTHPHPGVESPMAHAAIGPVAAVIDRARDAIQKVNG
jgi:hemerythrin superfamily protein